MSIITISNLTFSYEGSYDNVFENVSFQIDTDWKLGFTGRNGRGKTTFLRLLCGAYEYGGSITASADFDYFPYEVTRLDTTAIDVVDRVCPGYEQWALLRELSLLDVDEGALYRPFGTLSNGERTKVLLAALFLKENSFLLIDEPTNHLDMHGRALVSRYLNDKTGFILVSHDRTFLDGCIDHVLSINKANIEIQKGNFSSWLANKERQDSFELAENEKRQREISHLTASAKRASSWSDKVEKTKYGTKNAGSKLDKGYVGHKAAKMMKRSKVMETRRQSAIDEKSKLLQNIESADELKLVGLRYHTHKLASLRDVSIRYGDRTVCHDVNFTIEQGDRVALHGKNGSGKSSIMKLICGEPMSFTGDFHRGTNLRLSYVPQDTSFLRGDLSDFARDNNVDESIFKAMLRKLDFSRLQFEKDMKDFSGGQKKKVLIAKSLSENTHLLLWDEPLNFIDVISRIQIENLLLEYTPTILFVEHDAAFCQRIATKTVMLG